MTTDKNDNSKETKGNQNWDEGQETAKKGNQNWDDQKDPQHKPGKIVDSENTINPEAGKTEESKPGINATTASQTSKATAAESKSVPTTNTMTSGKETPSAITNKTGTTEKEETEDPDTTGLEAGASDEMAEITDKNQHPIPPHVGQTEDTEKPAVDATYDSNPEKKPNGDSSGGKIGN